jgi:hypothetical protein
MQLDGELHAGGDEIQEPSTIAGSPCYANLMSQGGGLINLGDRTKLATILIEKISDAIGGIFRPHQICRIAQAEVKPRRFGRCRSWKSPRFKIVR